MKTSCIVSNFNYASYVCEAIESALAQTTPFDDVIVVDDGSTDGSAARIRETFAAKITLLAKPANEGQGAAFLSGGDLARGDVLFFLDADDRYEPTYLARALAAYNRASRPDFVFCAHRLFDKAAGLDQPWPRDRDLGHSLVRTYFCKRFIGGPTSTLSMRRRVFDALRPALRPEDWRICADACLIDGASLIGARKYYLAEPLVRYRVHSDNSHHGKRQSPIEKYEHCLRTSRFAAQVLASAGFDLPHLRASAFREFRTIPEPDLAEFLDYLYLALTRSEVRQNRPHAVLSVLRHFLANRFRRNAPPK